MPIQTSHNGGTLQINLGTLQGWGDTPYINLIQHTQTATTSSRTGGDTIRPPDCNAYGYPQVNPSAWGGSWNYVGKFPNRQGNWIIDWVGDITILGLHLGITTVSGSLSGVNGRYKFYVTGGNPSSFTLRISAINEAVPFTRLRMYHEDDEALLDAGEKFNPTLVQMLQDMGCGNIRGGNWLPMNEQAISKWAHRKPQGYISAQAMHAYSSIYCGDTTNSGTDYSVTLPGGVDFDHQDMIIVKFNANGSGSNLTGHTLDFGDGAWPIRNRYGNIGFSTEVPAANRMGLLFRDDEIGVLCKWGGDSALLDYNIRNHMPYEDYIEFCGTVGAHIWIPVSAWGLDPLTDLVPNFMALHNDTAPSWMKAYWEGPNESWNHGASYPQTRYAWAKSSDRGWGASNVDDVYGQWMSLIGQAAVAEYGAEQKRSRYHIVVGVQTKNSPLHASFKKRLTCPLYVAAGGIASHNYVTDVATATYHSPTISMNDWLAKSFEHHNAGTTEEKNAVCDEVLTYVYTVAGARRFGIRDAVDDAQVYKTNLCDPYGLGLVAYEGGLNGIDFSTGNMVSTIIGVSKAAEAVVTLTVSNANGITSTMCPPVGTTVSFASVGGMTEINGQSGTVTEVTGTNTFKVNINSTSFTTYTSGGTITLANGWDRVKAFHLAFTARPNAKDSHLEMFRQFAAVGGRWPSYLQLSGMEIATFAGDSQWRTIETDVYETIDPKFPARLAAEEWNVPKPFKLRLTTS